MNFTFLPFLFVLIAAQEMPNKYKKMCNKSNCKTCQNYLMNFVIKDNDSKLFTFIKKSIIFFNLKFLVLLVQE